MKIAVKGVYWDLTEEQCVFREQLIIHAPPPPKEWFAKAGTSHREASSYALWSIHYADEVLFELQQSPPGATRSRLTPGGRP